MTGHLSALALDALALDASAEAARAHLASCPACQVRAAAARTLRGQLPAYVMVRSLDAIQRRSRLAWLVGSLALAAAALIVLRPAAVEPELSVKGGPALQVFALHDQHVFAVADGGVLAPGDELRFAVSPSGAGHVLIASIDGRGHATIYVPYDGEHSVAIDPQRRTELPGSIVLDDAPGPERVFAIFAAAPIARTDVLAALERLAADGAAQLRTTPHLALGFPATQASLLFEKAAP